MKRLLSRIRGAEGKRAGYPTPGAITWAGIGGFLGILTLALVGGRLDVVLLLGSFGASCVLLFGFPDVPFAQPANVVFGHFISAAIGLFFLHVCGPQPWSLGLAVGVAIMAMMATRTVHPPAGSNPVIVFLSHPGWGFLLFPVLAGAVLLTLVAILFHTLVRKRNYPSYW
jgi:CBS-domain-containing membrane protein